MPYFVVVNEQGPSWVDSRPMREQALWTEHADFVNALMREGFIVLGGPTGSGHPHRALLVVHAATEPTVRTRLLEDPWMRNGILRVHSIEPWQILVSDERFDPILAQISRTDPPP
jgi:uncharacterized protein YciI